jgi:hypothetical protein
MKEIKLSKGAIAIVDDEDYGVLSKHKWSLSENPSAHRVRKYAVRMSGGKFIKMHRLLMNPPHGFVVDHINGNGLDNRRCNLRVCSQRENSSNSENKRNGPYRGIGRMRNSWQAFIGINYKKVHLGTFKTPEEAAMAYDKASRSRDGKFARTNF